jgi:hypothetical protein
MLGRGQDVALGAAGGFIRRQPVTLKPLNILSSDHANLCSVIYIAGTYNILRKFKPSTLFYDYLRYLVIALF